MTDAGTPAILEVVAPGLLSTIQDLGRFGHRDEGVPVAGACDPIALAVANLVIGNAPSSAAIECTILGPDLVALADVVIGLAGADLGARLEPGGRPAAPGRAHRLSRGERLTFTGGEAIGCRAYIALPGGVDVPVLLGSRSTSLVGGFGGQAGRPLRAGDRIAAANAGRPTHGSLGRWPGPALPGTAGSPIRVVAGPGTGQPRATALAELRALLEGDWRVAAASDRRGLRLDGPPITSHVASTGASHGVLPGTVQLTPSGQPLVLLNDGGTTGGYPVIAVVIAADRWRLGQARPGDPLRFTATDTAAAATAALEQREWLAMGTRLLAASRSDPWDDLADDAGG